MHTFARFSKTQTLLTERSGKKSTHCCCSKGKRPPLLCVVKSMRAHTRTQLRSLCRCFKNIQAHCMIRFVIEFSQRRISIHIPSTFVRFVLLFFDCLISLIYWIFLPFFSCIVSNFLFLIHSTLLSLDSLHLSLSVLWKKANKSHICATNFFFGSKITAIFDSRAKKRTSHSHCSQLNWSGAHLNLELKWNSDSSVLFSIIFNDNQHERLA